MAWIGLLRGRGRDDKEGWGAGGLVWKNVGGLVWKKVEGGGRIGKGEGWFDRSGLGMGRGKERVGCV